MAVDIDLTRWPIPLLCGIIISGLIGWLTLLQHEQSLVKIELSRIGSEQHQRTSRLNTLEKVAERLDARATMVESRLNEISVIKAQLDALREDVRELKATLQRWIDRQQRGERHRYEMDDLSGTIQPTRDGLWDEKDGGRSQ